MSNNIALRIHLHSPTIGHFADGTQYPPIDGLELSVVSVMVSTAGCVFALCYAGKHPTHRVPRELYRILPRLPAFDTLNEFAFVAFGNTIGGENSLYTSRLQAVEIVAGLICAATAEPADVVADDGLEVAGVFGIAD